MTGLGLLGSSVSVFRSPWMTRRALNELRNRKLRRIVQHAFHHVPYYRELFRRAGLTADSIRTVADLQQLPVTSKRDLVEAGDKAFSTRYRADDLVMRRTTGSTGRPMTMRFDRRFEMIRKLLFLRALLAVGYRPGQRMLMMKANSTASGRRFGRWSPWETLGFDEPVSSMFTRLSEFKPSVVYGWVTPLRKLADHILDNGLPVDRVRSVITTAESLDEQTRQVIAEAFGAAVHEFYGLTEMGTVAWPCSVAGAMHVSEDTTYIEFESAGPIAGETSMVMTNLELTSMPLIRYATGDLGEEIGAGGCPCGRGFAWIGRIGGRVVDCLELADGRLISPYSVTIALESVEGLGRYQIVQRESQSLLLRYESSSANRAAVGEALRDAVAELVGTQTRIRLEPVDRLETAPGTKFRVIQSDRGT